jgi:nucleoside-diphosphate-sugar epimerase
VPEGHSTLGRALTPAPGQPAAWIDETVRPVPRNIYGVTKCTAEDLCELFFRSDGLPTVILRTARFFPEEDDDPERRRSFGDLNLKVNEYLYRRLDLADAVEAHILAAQQVTTLGFRRYILSATTPFTPDHLSQLHADAPAVVRQLFPQYEHLYRRRNWRMFPTIDRVYVNALARIELGWTPHYDFAHALDCLEQDADISSALARTVGSKGYHSTP